MNIEHSDDIVKDNIRVNALLSANVNDLISESKSLMEMNHQYFDKSKIEINEKMEKVTETLGNNSTQMKKDIEHISSSIINNISAIDDKLEHIKKVNEDAYLLHQKEMNSGLADTIKRLVHLTEQMEENHQQTLGQMEKMISEMSNNYESLQSKSTENVNLLQEENQNMTKMMITNQELMQKKNKILQGLVIAGLVVGILSILLQVVL